MSVKKAAALVLLAFVSAVLSLAASVGTPPGDLVVTYIANEGFLISTGGKALLVDALFNTSFGRYPVPSDALVAKMTDGQAPFQRIDAFLVTHDHGDHLHAPYVADFLKHHTETTLVASERVCASIRAAAPGIDRVHAFTLDVGGRAEATPGGISISAIRVKHMMDPDGTRVENLAYVIRVNGRTLLHVGDGSIEPNAALYRGLGLAEQGVDVLFLPYFDLSDATTLVVKQAVKPKHVVAMHVSTTGADGDLAKFRATYPNGVVFEKPLEAKTF